MNIKELLQDTLLLILKKPNDATKLRDIFLKQDNEIGLLFAELLTLSNLQETLKKIERLTNDRN
jgi:hypothetical protein